MDDREARLLRSVLTTTWRFYIWVGALLAVLAWGAYAYVYQLREGLGVTGLGDQVSWGLYIINFVFFIGISHAGTLISAILRVTQTEWRRPITRMAEAITVCALCIGGPLVIIDLGRPDRIHHLFLYGRIQSPIIWDVLSVSTYLAGCVLYFYLPLIPDVALLADQPQLGSWRRWLYRKLSLGYSGTPEQHHFLERAISVMAVIIIPLAVSVHTVVSWIFAMTLRPGWDSSIFGPYFVIGAIYSGAAGVVFSMWVLRRIFHLEQYIEQLHFRNLGLLLLAFAMLYLYFNINEYLTVGYKLEGAERELLHALFIGEYAWAFWTVQTVGVFVPLFLMLTVLGWKRYQKFTIPGVVLASALAIIGAWAKRYLIVIPTLQTPFLPAQGLPAEWTRYSPTWVEWAITAAALAGFLLLYTLLSKLFPIVSIWETRETADDAAARVPAAGPAANWTKPGPVTIGLVIVALGLTLPARAAAGQEQPLKQPALVLEWEPASPPEVATADQQEAQSSPVAGRVYWYSGRSLNPFAWLRDDREDDEEVARAAVKVSAVLRGPDGAPLAFKVVAFTLYTSFGKLSFGGRPTGEDGRAQLVVRDRRVGTYTIVASFAGDDEFSPVQIEKPVDFGRRPSPGLPKVGVLITPYATAAVGLPFFLFYGTMWVVFVYVFAYLTLYRMRRAGNAAPHPGE